MRKLREVLLDIWAWVQVSLFLGTIGATYMGLWYLDRMRF